MKGFSIMLKKLVIAVIAVVVGLTVVKKTELGSLMGVWWKNAKACARQQVPVETEIERLRYEVDRIGDDSKAYISQIAEQAVAVKNLRDEVATATANLEKQKKNVMALRDDLAGSEGDTVKVGDVKYRKDRVKSQLSRDFELYKSAEKQLETKRKLLEAREESLATAKQQLAVLQDERENLKVELAKLEAEIQTVRVAQTKAKVQIDDTDLAKINEGVARVRDRIKVEQEKLALQAEFSTGPIPVADRVKEKDLLKDIDAHFGKTQGDKVAQEKK